MYRKLKIPALALWTILAGTYTLSRPSALSAATWCPAYILNVCYGSAQTTETILQTCNSGNECGYNHTVTLTSACGYRYSCTYH